MPFSIRFFISIVLSVLCCAVSSAEESTRERAEFVGHYHGYKEGMQVSLELGLGAYKWFEFSDGVTLEAYDRGKLGYWEVSHASIDLFGVGPDASPLPLLMREDGSLLYEKEAISLHPVGPNFVGMLFQLNRSLNEGGHATHYDSEGMLEIQKDFSDGSAALKNKEALNLHNLGFQYQTGSHYRDGSEEKLTDQSVVLEGDKSQIDYEKAFSFYTKAAEMGYVQSMFNLAVFYEAGWHVEKSEADAVRWLRKAAEQGHTYSEEKLGNYLYYGAAGVPSDKDAAVRYWLSAAQKGNKRAQYEYGQMLLNKEGATDDERTEGEAWLRKAALRNHGGAFFRLFEYGMEKDIATGVSMESDSARETAAFIMQAVSLGDPQAHEYYQQIMSLGSE